MNYDRIILELMGRVAVLEDEVKMLKAEQENRKTDLNIHDNLFDKESVVVQVRDSGQSYNGRDTTKYILDGKRYGKNRLVLAVVKKYMEQNPNVSSGKLMLVFDKSLQGALGVIRTLQDVKDSYSDYERRFFCQPDEIIHTATEDCVVCTQWSKFNIDSIIARAKELGINITVL